MILAKINNFLDANQRADVLISALSVVAGYAILVLVGYFIPRCELIFSMAWSVASVLVVSYVLARFLLQYYNRRIVVDRYRTALSIGIFVSGSIISVVSVFANLYMHSELSTECSHDSFFDCFYMSFMTVTTVGYGDCAPKDHFGRVSAMLEAGVGFLLLGLFVSSIAQIYGRMASGTSHHDP